MAACREPRGREEGRVRFAACGVDEDVSGAGGAVAEEHVCRAFGVLGRWRHDAQVVHGFDAECGEARFGRGAVAG